MGTQKLGALLDAHTLPGEIVADIWTEVAKVSIAQSLAKTAPMVIGDNLLPVLSKRPSATIIDEGAQKKSSDLEIDMKRVEEAHRLYVENNCGARDDAKGMQYYIKDWKFDPKKPCMVR